ncbi:hypothetical protein [Pseudonocardia broussonetiae]|uniref:Baseplate assembly protein n=1 Tax=Pseudonocardia broussonetiae TaxID=2736640 RepID=A0A6M6JL92_9PSEU|nr:hypothetical protein [Pseudonocardia broussonetiae]QJY47963.1 hypothetical protein HOP40_20965 [Pseudonocardia broussonetiae]
MTARQNVGFHSMRAALHARLARSHPQLAAADATGDFAVALLDGWAVVAEILGFHAARTHEETSLDLAVELRSVAELARLVGYRPDPGVAAAVALAFAADPALGPGASVTVPLGTAVSSTPVPGAEPVTFETVEEIEARPAWNALRPRLDHRQEPDPDRLPTELLLAGTSTNVLPGDGILVPGPGGNSSRFGVVASVTVQPDELPTAFTPGRPGWTEVRLVAVGAGVSTSGRLPQPEPDPAPGPLVGSVLVADPSAPGVPFAELQERARAEGFAEAQLFDALRAARPRPRQVAVFRAQTGIFASTAPEWRALPRSLRVDLIEAVGDLKPPATFGDKKLQELFYDVSYGSQYFSTRPDSSIQLAWVGDTLERYPGAAAGPDARNVFCDVVVRGLGPGPVVLRDGSTWAVFFAREVAAVSKSVFTVSGRTTRLTLTTSDLASYGIRGTTVYVSPEWLPLAPESEPPVVPATGEEPGDPILLDDWVEGLHDGQQVAVTGMSATEPGTAVAHVARLADVRHRLARAGATAVRLTPPLPVALVRDTVRISANVAAATHGQTRSEVLGSGDARDPLPRFPLSAGPLTHLSSSAGSTSSLEVFVDGVRRPEVPALLADDEPGYVVHHDENGRATVQFGSPLPTGQVNVRAVYRVGVGTGAAVSAGALGLLAQRPAGVSGVTNPLPATGGADPETVPSARRNAPARIRALGRVVSLADYADFSAAFPGIAKARAVFTRGKRRRGVLVTVAGAGGGDVPAGSALHTALLTALREQGDPQVPVVLVAYQPTSFRVVGVLHLDAGRVAATVLAAAAAALTTAFAFDTRDLGQPVSAAEIVAALQGVPGVRGAHVSQLHRLHDGTAADPATLYSPLLPAALPVGGVARHAGPPTELLTLEPAGPILTVTS